MKNRYQRMTKEEKKALRKEYRETKKSMASRLFRIKFLGVFGELYGIGSFIFDMFFYKNVSGQNPSVWNYIIDGFLVVFCVVLLVAGFDISGKEYNRFAIQKNKNSNEKQEIKRKTSKKK